MRHIIAVITLFGVSLALTPASAATAYSGKVVGVSDGDTLTLLTPERQQIKIRLAEIDTPESRQAYGTRAKQALSDLVFGKEIRVEVQDIDRYGRTVGRVYVGSLDVNAEMVRQGSAWVYRRYAKDEMLFKLEDEAKAAKRGLWALPEAQRMLPWEWRKANRLGDSNSGSQPAIGKPAPATANAGGFACGTKRICAEMSSCAEARFYLEHCGLARLDGDRDGTPCETLCR